MQLPLCRWYSTTIIRILPPNRRASETDWYVLSREKHDPVANSGRLYYQLQQHSYNRDLVSMEVESG